MDVSSKHTDEIFALLDRFFISSGALGFWHDPSQIINIIPTAALRQTQILESSLTLGLKSTNLLFSIFHIKKEII